MNNLKKEWIALSEPWIREVREGRNPSRNGLLDEYMIAACGDIQGKKILDSGCGEGRFCRMLVDKGAQSVLGLDLCQPMIDTAKSLVKPNITYQVADVQQLDFIPDESFDLAVSYLNQCDLPDVEKNNAEIFRVLKKGGKFVIANLHPMRSCTGIWKRDTSGIKEHAIVDNYFEEGERHWNIMGVEITNFHRTLATYIHLFLTAGFILEGIVEPKVTKENVKKYPELDDELRVPNFIIYKLKKSNF